MYEKAKISQNERERVLVTKQDQTELHGMIIVNIAHGTTSFLIVCRTHEICVAVHTILIYQ